MVAKNGFEIERAERSYYSDDSNANQLDSFDKFINSLQKVKVIIVVQVNRAWLAAAGQRDK